MTAERQVLSTKLAVWQGVPQTLQTWLLYRNLVPKENPVREDCWWTAHAELCNSTLPESKALASRNTACKFSKPSMNADDVMQAVNGLARYYDSGLLVVHAPGPGFFWFQPGSAWVWLTETEASLRWDAAASKPKVMLYTERAGPEQLVGHYEPCVAERADVLINVRQGASYLDALACNTIFSESEARSYSNSPSCISGEAATMDGAGCKEVELTQLDPPTSPECVCDANATVATNSLASDMEFQMISLSSAGGGVANNEAAISETTLPPNGRCSSECLSSAVGVSRAHSSDVVRCIGMFLARLPAGYFELFETPPALCFDMLTRCTDRELSLHVGQLQRWKLAQPQSIVLDWLFSFAVTLLHARPGNVPVAFFTQSNKRPISVLSQIATSNNSLWRCLDVLKSSVARSRFPGTAEWLQGFAVSMVFFRASLPVTRTILTSLIEDSPSCPETLANLCAFGNGMRSEWTRPCARALVRRAAVESFTSNVPQTYDRYFAQPVDLLVCTILMATTPELVCMQTVLLRRQIDGNRCREMVGWFLQFIFSLLWERSNAFSPIAPGLGGCFGPVPMDDGSAEECAGRAGAPGMDGGSAQDPADALSPSSAVDHHECGIRMTRLRQLGVPSSWAVEAARSQKSLEGAAQWAFDHMDESRSPPDQLPRSSCVAFVSALQMSADEQHTHHHYEPCHIRQQLVDDTSAISVCQKELLMAAMKTSSDGPGPQGMPAMEGGSASDANAAFEARLETQVSEILENCPVPVDLRTARQAARRFPDDLARAIGEACHLACSPPRSDGRRRSRSPRRLDEASLMQWVPPCQGEVPGAGSWWQVPLVLDAADLLPQRVQALWRQHAVAGAWWGHTVDVMRGRRLDVRTVLRVLRQRLGNVTLAEAVQEQQRCEEDIRKLESRLHGLSGPDVEQFELQRAYLMMCRNDGYLSASLAAAFMESLLHHQEMQVLFNHISALRHSMESPASTDGEHTSHGPVVGEPSQRPGQQPIAATNSTLDEAALMRWVPPYQQVLPGAGSWWLVPLLLDTSDLLPHRVQGLWQQHPAAHAWWESTVTTLSSRRFDVRAVLRLLREKLCNFELTGLVQEQELCEGAIRMLESGLWPLSGAAIEHLQLRDAYLMTCDRGGYVSPLLQEVFLQSLLSHEEMQVLLCNVVELRSSIVQSASAAGPSITTGPLIIGEPNESPGTQTGAACSRTPWQAVGSSPGQTTMLAGSCQQQQQQPGHEHFPAVSSDTLALPVGLRVQAFWQARRKAVADAVELLYRRHMETDPRETAALTALFFDLPVSSPVRPESFRLTLEEVFAQELGIWAQRVSESTAYTGSIVDAWNSQLDIVKLLPHFLAVVCLFAEKTGIAREFPFAFILTMAPWVCHKDLHAAFNPRKPEHIVLARMFSVLIGDSNCGKSPFCRQCPDQVFISTKTRPCLLERLAARFASPGPGKDKTLFLQQATNSDFAKRLKAAQGHLFWMSEECWSVYDVAWAKGKSRTPQDKNKIQMCYLQDTQNGGRYGPLSINAEQYFVPSTNFAMWHAGQAKVIHDFWGAAFFRDCPFGQMGWEFRPTFLWPRNQPDDNTEEPHVTFSGASQFMMELLTMLVLVAGQTLDTRNFEANPILADADGAVFWERFRVSAETEKNNVPAHAKGAVGKSAFTTSGHITGCHLLSNAFRLLKASRHTLTFLECSGEEEAARCAEMDLGESWSRVPAELFLSAPEHVHMMLYGILVCYNEMKLPISERAGASSLDEASASSGRRRATAEPAPSLPPMTRQEEILTILLQRYRDETSITVTMVNTAVPRRLNIRSNQLEIQGVFQEAEKLRAGVCEGEPNVRPPTLRLRLTLENMSAASRALLSLPAIAVEEPPRGGSGVSAGSGEVPRSVATSSSAGPGMDGAGEARASSHVPDCGDGEDSQVEEVEGEEGDGEDGAPATVRYEDHPKKPSPKQAWALLEAWASDPERSGEPFKLEVHSANYWPGKVLARGICKKQSLCAQHPKCKFSVSLTYDTKAKKLAFRKKCGHKAEDLKQNFKLSKGFCLVGRPESRQEAPSRAEALKILSDIAADPSRSGEPFALTLKDRTSPSVAAVCRAECRGGTECGRAKCSFSIQLMYDAGMRMVAVAKKNGHTAEDERTDIGWQRRQPLSPDDWIMGQSVRLKAEDALVSQEELHARTRRWAATPGENGYTKSFVPICRSQPLTSMPQTLRSCLTCTSCEDKEACQWVGVSTFNTKTRQLTMKYYGEHSEGSQIRKRGFVTDHQKHLMQKSKAKGVGKIVALCDQPEALPGDAQVQNWCHRVNKKARADGKEEEPPKEWPVALIETMLKEAGIHNFSDSAGDHDVVVLDRLVWEEGGKERCAFVIGTKTTIRIFQKLVNKKYIKLGADATFKKTFDQWCFIPIGPITKRYAKTKPPGSTAPVSAWASHLTTAVWVLASGELARSYDIGFKALIKYVAKLVQGIDMVRDVKQVHTDMAASAEKARRENFPNSIGVKDFWHVLVAISGMLDEHLVVPKAEGDGKKYYSEIIGWVHRTRSQCLTPTETHNLWQSLRKHYSELGESVAMDIFFERYFVPVCPDAATRVYKAKNMTMLADGMILRPKFSCSIMDLEPGSASGSQCVEASHGGELGPNLQTEAGVPLLKATPDKLCPALRKMITTISRKYDAIKDLPDLPQAYDPKIMAGRHLAREGRSTSVELFRARQGAHGVLAHSVEVRGWGEVVVMPRSLLKFIRGSPGQSGEWVPFQLAELALTPEEAHSIAEMALELDGKRVFRLWQESKITVGGRTRQTIALDPKQWERLRYNYVVVLWGTAARKLWSQSAPELPDCLCNCTPFSLWGGCEHQQCARAMKDATFKLTTPGQNKGGRGRTNIAHHGVRSSCATKLRWAAARQAQKSRKPQRASGNHLSYRVTHGSEAKAA